MRVAFLRQTSQQPSHDDTGAGEQGEVANGRRQRRPPAVAQVHPGFSFKADHKSGVAGLAFHPTERAFFVLYMDGVLKCYDLDATLGKGGGMHAMWSVSWASPTEVPKGSAPAQVPCINSSLALCQLPPSSPGQSRAALVLAGPDRVVVGEVHKNPYAGPKLLASLEGFMPCPPDTRVLGVHLDQAQGRPAAVAVLEMVQEASVRSAGTDWLTAIRGGGPEVHGLHLCS